VAGGSDVTWGSPVTPHAGGVMPLWLKIKVHGHPWHFPGYHCCCLIIDAIIEQVGLEVAQIFFTGKPRYCA